MKLNPNLSPLSIKFPNKRGLPKNLINTSIAKNFRVSSKKMSFLEQFANEKHPHRVKHINFQFGKINNQRAVKYFLNNKPTRLIYSDKKDSFAEDLLTKFPANTKIPPASVTSQIARSLREFALKWVVEQFFTSINFLSFDEPILEGVNPDCMMIPTHQAPAILDLAHDIKFESNRDKSEISKDPFHLDNLVEVEIDDAIFVEIKAYHGSTIVGEKEVLQAFNYASRGGKALLITTGDVGDLKGFDIINKGNEKSTYNFKEGYDPVVYQKFCKVVKKKFRKKIKKIDMRLGQDSYDTRGIYISSGTKLKKMHKYSTNLPKKIEFDRLKSSKDILKFLISKSKLGIVEAKAFKGLLKSRNLLVAKKLFETIQKTYLEEMMINPTLMYPTK